MNYENFLCFVRFLPVIVEVPHLGIDEVSQGCLVQF